MTIACIGWGSLIWDPQNLPITLPWRDDGPNLAVEFARQSAEGHLTLVIVENGPALPCLWAPMLTDNLNEAISQLRARERTVTRHIGFWKSASAPEAISRWAEAKGLSGVVWTALPPKFQGVDGRAPTLEEACIHLASLKGPARERAEKYVRRAPIQIRTPYREAIEEALGWDPYD